MTKEQRPFTTPKNRAKTLTARRNLKMAQSVHAYVRGSTSQFYEWLQDRGDRAVPKGPPVWICGDCHVGNLGPVADSKGSIDVQIRDLDQTVIGNPSHDLIRLALSLASAARSSDLPGVTTAKMLEQIVEGYEHALRGGSAAWDRDRRMPDCVEVAMRRAVDRTWKHLARERLKNIKPNIPLGKRFWPLTGREIGAIHRLFKAEEIRRLVTSLKSRADDADIEVLDVAYWMKGCSSLGRLRFAVLVGIGKRRDSAEDLCLMDIKEAVSSAAPRTRGRLMPRDNAKRVVEGARQLSPALGERMRAARLLHRPVFLRELMPQDLALEIGQLTRKQAVSAARFLAMVVGRAHARQMDPSTRRDWRDSLKRNRSKSLDAPSWLWSSVVELTASHEAAYLEHCRRYARESLDV
jgi:uncharacterized protein (DUF2252 family)